MIISPQDEVRNVNSAAGERRGEELSNNYKSDVPPYQSEHVTSPDAARSRLSRQSKIQDQEESEGNNISDGKNVLGLEDRVRDDSESVQTYANVVQDQGLVNHYSEQGHEYANDNSEDRRAAGVYGDGYANDVPEDTANEVEPHPGEDEYLRDSLEEDVPRDYEIGREQELRKVGELMKKMPSEDFYTLQA
ncbi:hypothetical protein BSL78_22499 [Apostichopus japonicus]|uniref:Uncharacterized protein n=1 Tax=Stichopus japonicus TaxID=307972 RepID=A0A2G8JXZ8_STIJA|nr:hypothetical protein BSL78_22499 [Apostichopus japonicus]